MKMEFRGISTKRVLPLLVILFIFLCVYGIVIYVCLVSGMMQSSERIVLIAMYSCIILLPCIVVLIWLVTNYRKKYILTSTELVSIYGNHCHVIPKEAIHFIGCAAFVHRGAFIFFSWATSEEIVAFANQNWEKRMRLFGESLVTKLEQTDLGIRQMQIGVYLKFAKGDKIIKRELDSIEQMADICDFWDVTPILTGPIILEHPEFWKRWNNTN